jgi:hypothetical protein
MPPVRSPRSPPTPHLSGVVGLAQPPNPVVALTAVPDAQARPFRTSPFLPAATRLAVVPFRRRQVTIGRSPQDQHEAAEHPRDRQDRNLTSNHAARCPRRADHERVWGGGGGNATTAGRVAPSRGGLVENGPVPASGTAARVTTGFGSEPNPATPHAGGDVGTGVDTPERPADVRTQAGPGRERRANENRATGTIPTLEVDLTGIPTRSKPLTSTSSVWMSGRVRHRPRFRVLMAAATTMDTRNLGSPPARTTSAAHHSCRHGRREVLRARTSRSTAGVLGQEGNGPHRPPLVVENPAEQFDHA